MRQEEARREHHHHHCAIKTPCAQTDVCCWRRIATSSSATTRARLAESEELRFSQKNGGKKRIAAVMMMMMIQEEEEEAAWAHRPSPMLMRTSSCKKFQQVLQNVENVWKRSLLLLLLLYTNVAELVVAPFPCCSPCFILVSSSPALYPPLQLLSSIAFSLTLSTLNRFPHSPKRLWNSASSSSSSVPLEQIFSSSNPK